MYFLQIYKNNLTKKIYQILTIINTDDKNH
jgi:predicted transcriptional regulator